MMKSIGKNIFQNTMSLKEIIYFMSKNILVLTKYIGHLKKERWYYYKQDKNLQKSSQEELIDSLADPIKVYEYISEKFIDELKKDNQKFMIVPTLKPSIFLKDDYHNFRYDFLKKTWGQNNFYDPYLDAVRYMEDKGIFKFPFLSWTCDSHYSHAGADFYSTYLTSIID